MTGWQACTCSTDSLVTSFAICLGVLVALAKFLAGAALAFDAPVTCLNMCSSTQSHETLLCVTAVQLQEDNEN